MGIRSTEVNTKRLEVRLQLYEHPVTRSKASDEKYKLWVGSSSVLPLVHI